MMKNTGRTTTEERRRFSTNNEHSRTSHGMCG
jgi:hypothetical protein